MARLAWSPFLLLLSLVPGCRAETDACGGEQTDACCCFERIDMVDDIDGPLLYIDNSCGTQDLCPDLRLQCPGDDERLACGADTAIIENPEALTCILDALAAGKTGHLRWDVTGEEYPGWANKAHDLWAFADQALYAMDHRIDLGGDLNGVTLWQLRPAADFAACRDATEDAERLACLFEPAADTVEVCIPPGA